jgi:rod shape-determining protein MreC
LSDFAGQSSRLYLSSARITHESVLEIRSPESSRPVAPRTPETPQVVQAFISRHRPFFVLLGVLLGQLVLLSAQITRDHNVRLAKVWAETAFGPFERSLRGLADVTGAVWDGIRDVASAERQNRELRAQLAESETRIRQLAEQSAENDRLRTLLDYKVHAAYTTVAAEVIGSSPGEGSTTLLIDKGSDFRFTPDLAVITPDGAAGKIVAIYPHTAQVLLLTDPTAGAGGMLDQSRAQGVLKGTGRGMCRFDYLMNGESVSVGDLVVTSGLDQVFPKGLPLGRVVEVSDGNIYKSIMVKPAVALDHLEEVLVVVPKNSQESEDRSQESGVRSQK